jgi:hypothetical protein
MGICLIMKNPVNIIIYSLLLISVVAISAMHIHNRSDKSMRVNYSDGSSDYFTSVDWREGREKYLASELCRYSTNVLCKHDSVFVPYGDMVPINVERKRGDLKKAYESGFIDPWIYGAECITQLRYSEIMGKSEGRDYAFDVLEKLYSLFLRNDRRYPHPAYGKFSSGWVSSMDIPTVALCAHIAYLVSGDKRYKAYRDEFVDEIAKDVKVGGFVVGIDNNLWFSEYADLNTDKNNEMYVLNGFLIALQSVYMLAESMDSADVMDIYKKALNAYRSISGKYWYRDNLWSYYMLNPPEPIPPHYMIFETKQLVALSHLDSSDFYLSELQKHRVALKNMLPIYRVKNSEGKNIVYLYRAIVDPYLIDIYHTRVVFKDKYGQVVRVVNAESAGDEIDDYNRKHFIKFEISDELEIFDFYSVNSAGTSFKLFEGTLDQAHSGVHYEYYNYNIDVDYDAYKCQSEICINDQLSIKDEANLWVKFDKDILQKKPGSYFAFEIQSDDYKYIQVVLYGSDSSSAYRNYTKLLPGNNLVLLHWPGFYGVDSISDALKMRVRIYTSPENKKQLSRVVFGNVVYFDSQIGVHDYMSSTPYKVNLIQ